MQLFKRQLTSTCYEPHSARADTTIYVNNLKRHSNLAKTIQRSISVKK